MPEPTQAPRPTTTAAATGVGLLGLLPLLLLGALLLSLALGRPPLLSAWPVCTHLVEEEHSKDASASRGGGGGQERSSPAKLLHVPVFLTQADAEARRAALSVLKRAREAYRQELVVRMKALARMADERVPDWRGHAAMPALTAALQERLWEANRRVPECWEANERVLDTLLRLPEPTVGLPPAGPVAAAAAEEAETETAGVSERVEEKGGGGGSSSGSGSGSSGSGGATYNDGVQVLTHLLRDWAAEGEGLRRRTYGPILRAVARLFPHGQGQGQGHGGGGGGARILVPGAGLGRLAFELAYGPQGGHRVTALDISPVMVAAMASVLERVLGLGVGEEEEEEEEGPPPASSSSSSSSAPAAAAALPFFPYVHDPLLNQRDHAARFQPIAWPDAEARRTGQRAAASRVSHSGQGSQGSLALELGDLLALAEAQPGSQDAVVTCFFIDTGRQVLDYLWAIRRLLRPGGIWVNLGPLNYHQTLPDGAVQLSLEELELAAAGMGLVPQPEWALEPEPCAYRPEPFAALASSPSSAFLRTDVYRPAFGVYRLEA